MFSLTRARKLPTSIIPAILIYKRSVLDDEGVFRSFASEFLKYRPYAKHLPTCGSQPEVNSWDQAITTNTNFDKQISWLQTQPQYNLPAPSAPPPHPAPNTHQHIPSPPHSWITLRTRGFIWDGIFIHSVRTPSPSILCNWRVWQVVVHMLMSAANKHPCMLVFLCRSSCSANLSSDPSLKWSRPDG